MYHCLYYQQLSKKLLWYGQNWKMWLWVTGIIFFVRAFINVYFQWTPDIMIFSENLIKLYLFSLCVFTFDWSMTRYTNYGNQEHRAVKHLILLASSIMFSGSNENDQFPVVFTAPDCTDSTHTHALKLWGFDMRNKINVTDVMFKMFLVQHFVDIW